jgi:hypothetical protein
MRTITPSLIGSTSDEKEGFIISNIRNTPLKEKGQNPPMRKEATMFHK